MDSHNASITQLCSKVCEWSFDCLTVKSRMCRSSHYMRVSRLFGEAESAQKKWNTNDNCQCQTNNQWVLFVEMGEMSAANSQFWTKKTTDDRVNTFIFTFRILFIRIIYSVNLHLRLTKIPTLINAHNCLGGYYIISSTMHITYYLSFHYYQIKIDKQQQKITKIILKKP